MTPQIKETSKRINEFNTLFVSLNEKGQEAALTVLQSLRFAQSVTRSECNPTLHTIKEDKEGE